MSVCNFCTHISCCGNSPFPKRPRIEGERLLPALENGMTKSVFNATLQASQAHKTSLRTPRPPPPLVKTVQSGSHHRTSAVPCSETEPPEISYRALCKVYPRYSSRTGLEPTKRGYSCEVDKNNNTNSEQHSEIVTSTKSSHDNIHKDTSMTSNHVKKEWTEKRSRYRQSNTTDTEKNSYSVGSDELPEHVLSSKACDQALDRTTTREHVQQERQERCFVKSQEKRFVSSEGNQSGKGQSCDAKVKEQPSVCKCCSEPRSLLGILERRQNMPHNHHALGVAPREYKEEHSSTARDNSYENNRATSEKYANYPALSPTGYHKCSTELYKHSYKNQQLALPPRDKIAQCYPTTKADHPERGDSPFKFQAPKFSLPESTVPQLRRGRPRKRGLRDKSSGYGGVPKYCPTSCQSLHNDSVSLCNRSMQTNDDHVFCGSSCSDKNNNSTRATDQIRYKPSVTNDSATRSVRNFEHEQQITRQPAVVLDQPRKSSTPGAQHHRNTNNSATTPVHRYLHFSREKTHNIKNIDRNRKQMGPWTQYQEACRNHCHDTPSVSRDETTNVRNLLQGPKRKSSCSDDSKFVTTLNQLLKRRTDATERQQKSNFSFDETQKKEATLFQNEKVHTQSSQCQEERREATIFQTKRNVKSVEENQKPANSECDENRRMGTTGSPNERTETQSLHRRVAEKEPGRSASRRLPIPNCVSRIFKATGGSSGTQASYSVENKALNDRATATSKTQQPCHSSCAVPLPPDEDELDDMDSGCGGYAIDHSFLPKIVAVHSIVKRDETREADQSRLSATDKKYWNDHLNKVNSEMSNFNERIEFQQSKQEMIPEVSTTSNLRSLLKGSKVIDNQKQKEPSPEDRNVTVSPKKDSITQLESSNEGKINENISQWTMWEYLSTSSNNVTIHVRDPSAYTETEKKTQLPRKKPTVAELSKKILITRERIQKETIPWKKKLLHSLEAIFIKRLRKTEKETGVKSSISFEEEKVNEESKEKKKNGQKERRNSQGGKEKAGAPRPKQTTKKKL